MRNLAGALLFANYAPYCTQNRIRSVVLGNRLNQVKLTRFVNIPLLGFISH